MPSYQVGDRDGQKCVRTGLTSVESEEDNSMNERRGEVRAAHILKRGVVEFGKSKDKLVCVDLL